MAISINPLYIAGAVQYAEPLVATNSPLCDGLKEVGVQLRFNQVLTWYFDLNIGVGSTNPPLDTIACIYFDLGQSFSKIYVYFPESGYSALIGGGSCVMLPVPANTLIPVFYIILSPAIISDTIIHGLDARTPTGDIVNITMYNKMLPMFNNNAVITAVNYGMGSFTAPTPVFVMDKFFGTTMTNPASLSALLINNRRWFITGILVTGANITVTADCVLTFLFNNNGNAFLGVNFQARAGVINSGTIIDVMGLNFESGPSNVLAPMTVVISASGGAISTMDFRVNLYGGVLVL